jgi:hypothetical protein
MDAHEYDVDPYHLCGIWHYDYIVDSCMMPIVLAT